MNTPKMPAELKEWFISESHNAPSSKAYKEWSRRDQSECFEVARTEGYQDASEAMHDRIATAASKNFETLHWLIHDTAYEISIGKLGKAQEILLKADQLSHVMVNDPTVLPQEEEREQISAEAQTLIKMDEMCAQSLPPNLFEAWGEIAEALRTTCRALKEMAVNS